MLENIRILWHQGKQYIPDIRNAKIPGIFRGRPVISTEKLTESQLTELIGICPTGAIEFNTVSKFSSVNQSSWANQLSSGNLVSIDLGKCTFCGECALRFPGKISFTKDYKLATNERERLLIMEGDDKPITINPDKIRKEIIRIFGSSLKLRQVSAGGDNSNEWELNAANNVQFDMSRFGIDFVASPRHADGIVITGPITANMAPALQLCYDAIPEPKIIILAGTDAISGGIFVDSPALNREFIAKYTVDLYIPGNPVHPLTFINAVLDFLNVKGNG